MLYMENTRLAKENEQQNTTLKEQQVPIQQFQPCSNQNQSCQTDTNEDCQRNEDKSCQTDNNEDCQIVRTTTMVASDENLVFVPISPTFESAFDENALLTENIISVQTIPIEEDAELTEGDSASGPSSHAKENVMLTENSNGPTSTTKEKMEKGKKYVCDKCGYTAIKKSHLANHISEYCKKRDVSAQVLFACPICRGQKTYTRLMMHLRQYTLSKHKPRKNHGQFTTEQHTHFLNKLIKTGKTGAADWETFVSTL